MKKSILLVLCLCLILLTACSTDNDSKQPEPQTQAVVDASESAVQAEATDAQNATPANNSLQWPIEFDQWNLPKLESGILTVADNKSVADGVMATGLVAVVNVKDVTPEAFKSYTEALIKSGLTLSPDSLGDALSFYERKSNDGVLKMTLSYSEGMVSIIADNTAAASKEKTSSPASASNWPEVASAIPAFTDGSYVETIDMGGNMYTLTYKDVPASALENYSETLLAAGFVSQGNETNGYARMDTNAAYSVGFYMAGDTLQIVIAVGTY